MLRKNDYSIVKLFNFKIIVFSRLLGKKAKSPDAPLPTQEVHNPLVEDTASSATASVEGAPVITDLQTLVNALPKITVGIVTYNCGNENLPADTVAHLQATIATFDTDLLFFSFQESKLSLRLMESLVKRILKRFTINGTEENPYTLLEYKEIYTPTHMNPFKDRDEAARNFFNLPRAKVALAFKNDCFPAEALIATPFRKHTPWSLRQRKFNFDNKGGMYNKLTFTGLDNFEISFIGVHLDSEDSIRAKRQADALLAYAAQQQTLEHSNVTFMAGDFNIRIHEGYVKEKHQKKPACLEDLLRISIPEAIAGSIDEWQDGSKKRERIYFASMPKLTYCKINKEGKVPYSAARKTHDIGALDLIGYTKSKKSRATVQHEENLVTILEPLHPHTGEEASDHKAVITKYTVLPPITSTQKQQFWASFAITSLNDMHRILHEANHSDLMRIYFEYAIEARGKVYDDACPIRYHLRDIESIKQDITFIIAHLSALCDQKVEAVFKSFIFTTCQQISVCENDGGAFIQEKYQQLRDVETGSRRINKYLLEPFTDWLLQNRNQTELGQIGFFAGSRSSFSAACSRYSPSNGSR